MAVRRFRIPGLQVPSSADGELLAFLSAVKERLELSSGEKGDPEQRAVTLRELKDAGLVTVNTRNQYASLAAPRAPSNGGGTSPSESDGTEAEVLDLTLLPDMPLSKAPDNLQMLVQGTTVSDRYRVLLMDLFTMFARVDQETATQFPYSFQAEGYGFEVAGPAPRFRLLEQSEDSDVEAARPLDENIWEVEVDDSELSVYLVNDAEDTRVQVLAITRTGTIGDAVNIKTTALQHNDEQVIVFGGVGLDKTGDTLDILEEEIDHNSLDNLDVGDPHPQYARRLDQVLSPAQIVADEDDYEPAGLAGATVLRVESDAARTITGLAPWNGVVFNVGAFDITLSNENELSAAANRFALAADVVLPPGGSATLWYDTVNERHRCRAVVT